MGVAIACTRLIIFVTIAFWKGVWKCVKAIYRALSKVGLHWAFAFALASSTVTPRLDPIVGTEMAQWLIYACIAATAALAIAGVARKVAKRRRENLTIDAEAIDGINRSQG